ncbi:LytR/AlgR family response regulator transcription factor [Emticicia soli]|uniref:LytR/AlgR family response regulator transcription factor n=1 Tax=Emticicia soli TaxID=2027878 RepID=A0ABW5JH36_9BACT
MMTQEPLIRLGWHTKIDPGTILFMKADSNYTEVHLNNGNIILSATSLGRLAKRLPSCQFIRPNRSVLVNLDFMTEYQKIGKSIRMNNNEVIKVSRRRTKQVTRSINTY